MSQPQRMGVILLSALVLVPTVARSVASISYTPEQIIAARQASYEMSVVTFAAMQLAMKSGGSAKKQSFAAQGLAKWAKVLPTLFPDGTGIGQTAVKTDAKLEIWSDRAEFERLAANYLAQTQRLAELAAADDAVGFTAQLGEVKKACDACHDKFKER